MSAGDNDGRSQLRRRREEKPYTIVGDDRHDDKFGTFVDWVWGVTAIDAVWTVLESRNIAEQDVIAVFAGHHVDLNPMLARALDTPER